MNPFDESGRLPDEGFESLMRAGELELVHGGERLVCDLIVDEAWRGAVSARHFPPAC